MDISESDVTSGGKCFAFDKYHRAVWQTCSQRYKSVCKTKNGGFIKVNRWEWHLPWVEYIKKCLSKNCNPITYADVVNEPKQLYRFATSLTWTNIIRIIVTYKYTGFNSSRNIAYGYLKRENGYISLYFTPDGKAAKQALFITTDATAQSSDKTTSMSGISSSTTTSNQETASTLSSSPESTIDESIPQQATQTIQRPANDISTSMASISSSTTTSNQESSSTVSSSPESTIDESIPQQATQTIQNSDVGVSVGLSVTAVIIVVTAVVIIVTLKRRGKIQTKCFRQAESECTAYISTELHPGSKNDKHAYEMSSCSPYDQIDDLGLPSERCSDNEGTDNVISGHTYFILEKHTWESDTDDNIETMTKTEASNVYNTLNSNENITGSSKSENTYDSTERVAMKLKVQHHKNVDGDATENTYNHTSSRRLVKIGKTDNVYGVLNKIEGEYDDVDTRNVKSQFNGGDTYSHIMKEY